MRPDLKQEWLARLRRGDIPQIRGVHGWGDARCALGILCDIAAERGVTSRTTGHEGLVVYGGNWWDLVPPEVATWSELDRALLATIATRNDDGASFAEIAEFIDRHVHVAVTQE